MSTFTTSRNTRGQHVSPRQCVVYRPSPARREHIFGRIRPQVEQHNPLWWRVGRIIMVLCAVYALKLAVMG